MLPSKLASLLLDFHNSFVYVPLNAVLSSLADARLFPKGLTPNAVTIFAGLCLGPCVYLLKKGDTKSLYIAGGLTLLHDGLDRLDGAVARSPRFQDPRAQRHDGRFGAFLDAQVDKIFHVGMLTALLFSHFGDLLGTPWRYFAYAKIFIQLLLFAVRWRDYLAPKHEGGTMRARGEGKLATFAANMAAAGALFTIALQEDGHTDSAKVGRVLVTVLLALACDMALRSLIQKVVAWRSGK